MGTLRRAWLPARFPVSPSRYSCLLLTVALLVVGPARSLDAIPAGASPIPEGASASPAARTLTLEERLAAQRSLEEVTWRHRIWPEANGLPKPSLDQAAPPSALREKVEDYLKKSTALEKLWGRPITARQLQAEMRRMARNSRQPQVLQELFQALDNDPFLIAECLARPLLADRLLRSGYARDDRFHGALRAEAEHGLARYATAEGMKRMGGEYSETTWRRAAVAPGPTSQGFSGNTIALNPETYAGQVKKLAGILGADAASPSSRLPLRRVSSLQEEDDSFFVLAVLDQDDASIRTATVSWPKTSFNEWWSREARSLTAEQPLTEGGYAPVSLDSGGCTDDTWSATKLEPPDARTYHTAVWTGAEMILFGGTGGVQTNQGYRYDPATDTWTGTSLVNAPAPRYDHVAVWTGSTMIVWGGNSASGYLNTGGRYDPSSDTWTATNIAAGVPAPRARATAVWTGTEMIVWGGYSGAYLNSGGRYDPATDSWTPTGTGANLPEGRSSHTAVWTGTEMIVWGGNVAFTSSNGGYTNTGGHYRPSSDSWLPTGSGANTPSSRSWHSAVWTGNEMIVYGGTSSGGSLGSAARYDPAAGSWTAMPAFSIRQQHTAVWTGTEMIVWGGYSDVGGTALNSGGRYSPTANSWIPTATSLVPTARYSHTAVWTGSEMIVWGGSATGGVSLNSGGRYSPAADSWIPTGIGLGPAARYSHTAVWTGSEMIVWGGVALGNSLNSGSRYTPATDTWNPISLTSAPAARSSHTAVWTGTRMLVWGGLGGAPLNSGGGYDPINDSWTATSTGANAPSPRSGHTAVWTGSAMIVWGGSGGSGYLNTGARYAPGSDTWGPVSITGSTPAPRSSHTAVWTGTRMIVWGGQTAFPLNPGGSYDPLANAWTLISTGTGVPAARSGHTVVWTGSEMIVWGGVNFDGSVRFNTGGRYDPGQDSWTPTSTGTGVPAARSAHTAVWSGGEMIVWGGSGSSALNTGGRYDPATDSWTPTSTGASVPSVRSAQSAVWTGSEMIIWGGYDGGPLPTGGRYCRVCAASYTHYRDADGDAYGDPGKTVVTCNPVPLPGFAAVAGDCDDTRSSVRPGAPQLCDGINNDCSDPSWPTAPANEVDADADGYRICAGDCNDASPATFPGAPQLCDGVNNNCTDPSWPAVPANEADADADGYRICSGDCNDTNAAVHPGAAEICNQIDDNCNAQVDEDTLGVDSDGDGIHNACDNCRFVANPSQVDADHDNVGNACDNCIAVPNPNQSDTDADGVGNACDICPVDYDPGQADADQDRVGDACDNCASDFNPDQGDFNHDGEGDVCDLDDGLIYLFVDNPSLIRWQPEQGPTVWNVYRGDLAVLRSTGVYTQPPGSNPLAERICGLTDDFTDDTAAPTPGKAVFTLVTGVQSGTESSLGKNSAGADRANTSPCP